MISRNTKMKRKQRKVLQQQSTQLVAMKAAANAVCNHMYIHGVPKVAKEWLEKYFVVGNIHENADLLDD